MKKVEVIETENICLLTQKIRKLYNGDVISEITGLRGKTLGKFMQRYDLNPGKWSDDEIEFHLRHSDQMCSIVEKLFSRYQTEQDYQNEKS